MSQRQGGEGTMKKLIRKGGRFKGQTLGLDIHKKFIEYCVLDGLGDEVVAGRIESSREDLRELVAKLKKQGAVQASLEACGCFIWVFDLLVQELAREAVHVAQPSRIHVIANSMEKNDANDAWWLAYLLFEGRLPESFVVEGVMRNLRIAERELRSYTNARSDLLRRFKSHFAQEGTKIPKSWHASKIGRTRVVARIKETKGDRHRALTMLLKQIKKLSSQMLYWRARIVELSKELPAVKTIEENLPGFGSIVAGTVVGELGDPRRFYNQKAYAKATGLTPGYRESGGKGTVTAITRQGSRHARWAFTRAVISCMRCKQGPGVHVRQWVEERSRHKPKKKVIVAAARKFAEAVWRLFALGEAFDLTRAFPVKVAATS
jgi:transposase